MSASRQRRHQRAAQTAVPPRKPPIAVPGIPVQPRPSRRAAVLAAATGIGGFFLGSIGDYAKTVFEAVLPPSDLAERIRPRMPLEIIIDRNRSVTWQGTIWVFREPLTLAPAIHAKLTGGWDPTESLEGIVYDAGGVDPYVSLIQVILQGAGTDTVTITAIEAVVERREPALSGTLLQPGPQGEQDGIAIGIDLDSSSPGALQVAPGPDVNDEDFFGAPYFLSKSIVIAPKEQVSINVAARTKTGYVSWRLRILYRSGGEQYVEEYGLGERNFETTALIYKADANGYPTEDYDKYQEVYESSLFASGPIGDGRERFVRVK